MLIVVITLYVREPVPSSILTYKPLLRSVYVSLVKTFFRDTISFSKPRILLCDRCSLLSR